MSSSIISASVQMIISVMIPFSFCPPALDHYVLSLTATQAVVAIKPATFGHVHIWQNVLCLSGQIALALDQSRTLPEVMRDVRVQCVRVE